MRSLSSTLESAQKGFGELLVKLVLTSGANLYAYTNETADVIQYLKEQESSASQQAQVTISNFNNNLSALTLEGYGAVVSFGYRTGVSRSAWVVGTAYAIDDIVVPTSANGYQYRCKVAGTSHAATEPTWPTSLGDTVADNTVTWEMDGNSGDEYSRCPAFVVKGQELSHAPANLSCALHLYGLPDQLDQDEASAAYAPDTTNTDTVKTIFAAIAGATLAAYNHCTAVTVVWDSEDSLVDTFMPKDLLRIAVGDSRFAKLKWLLAWTKCVMRFENDGKIHVFVPRTTGGADWVSPTSVTDASALWADDNNTFDGDTATLAYATVSRASGQADYIQFNIASMVCDKVRIWANISAGTPTTKTINVDAYYNGQWNDVYDNTLTENEWVEYSLGARYYVTAFRCKFAYTDGNAVGQARVFEVDFHYADFYQYSLDDAQHPFFTKIYRRPLVLPNRVSIASNPGDSPSYSGESTSAASYALLPKSEFKNMTLASDAQAAAIAAARIQNYEQDAEKGQGFVPMNVGQEVYDYVNIVDSVEDDSREGNVGYLTRIFDLNNKRYPYAMSFGFGRVPVGSLIGTGAIGGAGGGAGGVVGSGPVTYSDFLSVVNDIYENFNDLLDYMDKRTREINIVDDSVPDTLDALGDGSTYKRVLGTHLDANGLKVTSLTTFAAGYDPNTKRRVFNAEPTTPYDLGDLWQQSTIFKKCTTARASGAYVAGDWTAITVDELGEGSVYGRLKQTIIAAGLIQVGTGTKDSTLNGWHISDTEIVGQLDGADRVVLATDGTIKLQSGASKWYSGATLIGTISQLGGGSPAWILTAESGVEITIVPGAGAAIQLAGATLLAGVIEPTTDLGQSLGEPTKRWDYLYARYLGHASYHISTAYVDIMRVGAFLTLASVTSDPASPAVGDAWFRSDLNEYRGYKSGAVYIFDMTAA